MIYDYKTSNESFIKVHYQLKAIGVRNNEFFLLLMDESLQGVNPHDPFITDEVALRVITECMANPYYYLREVVRIPEQGGTTIPFRLDRGTLASIWCFINSIDHYLMKPRQTGKTVGIDGMLSWAFKFGATNSDFMFVANDEEVGKKNLKYMASLVSALPPYIANLGIESVDSTGKKKRRTDNAKTYAEPGQNNKAIVAKRAPTLRAAEKIGRGFSQVYQFFDEAEFTDYIDIIVKVSGMAYNTASNNAAKNGCNHCRIFATTPGDLSDDVACGSAMKIVKDSLVWSERFYDQPINEVKELIKKKSKFRIVYIEYDYKQLGLTEDWFINACSKVGGDVVKIRREILLERFQGNSKSPFKEIDIQEIVESQIKPKATVQLGKLYDIIFYKKPKKNRTYFVSIDPSDGTGSDNYGLIVLDPYTLDTIIEFRSEYMTVDGMFDLMIWLVSKHIPKCMIIIEKNRGMSLIDKFMSHPLLKRKLYHSPEASLENINSIEHLDEKGFIKEKMARRRYFGITTGPNNRDIMMGILVDAVKYKKSLMRTQYLVEDVTNLVIKNGKIQADTGKHDDIVMCWVIALYTYYYGKDLHKFGFRRGEIPDDVEEDDEFLKLKVLYENPEIQKAFPSMYQFYLSQKVVREQLLMEHNEEVKETYKPTKIGGIIDKEVDEAYNVETTQVNSSLMSLFSSLNN